MAHARNEVGCVGEAGLPRRRVEVGGFGRGAADCELAECGGDDPADPVGGWVDVVHPVAPEDGELAVGSYDAVEEGEHYEEEGEDLALALVAAFIGWRGNVRWI